MGENRAQKFFAYAALFFLPFSALKFDVSFTYADVLLLLAILLNSSELLRVQSFQIPFLLAFPLFLLSGLFDTEGSLKSIVQIIYIWGFILPFGWCAFSNLPAHRIAQVLLLSTAINGFVSFGQGAHFLPMLETQKNIDIGVNYQRAAGLVLSCNSLVMVLTPFFVLLPYVRHISLRTLILFTGCAGMAATVSKSVILAIPGFLYYAFKEREKWKIFLLILLFTGAGFVFVKNDPQLEYAMESLSESIEYRLLYAEDSFDDRAELIRVAMEYADHCYFLGYGTTGAAVRIGQETGNTIHVYYLGILLIAGLPAAALLMTGFIMMITSLWMNNEKLFAAYVITHLVACGVSTVLLLSFQSLPFMVAGAVLVRAKHRIEANKVNPALKRNPATNNDRPAAAA